MGEVERAAEEKQENQEGEKWNNESAQWKEETKHKLDQQEKKLCSMGRVWGLEGATLECSVVNLLFLLFHYKSWKLPAPSPLSLSLLVSVKNNRFYFLFSQLAKVRGGSYPSRCSISLQ